MTLRPSYLIGLLVGAMLLVSALAMGRLQTAHTTQDAAIGRLHAARADARELISLRSQTERVGSGHRAPEDVMARLHDALLATGLATNRLTQFNEVSDSEVPGGSDGPRYRRQSIRLTLAPIELPELGRFLDHWRRAEPLWVPVNIELLRASSARRARNGHDGYSASITIAATYVDTSPTTSTTPTRSTP